MSQTMENFNSKRQMAALHSAAPSFKNETTHEMADCPPIKLNRATMLRMESQNMHQYNIEKQRVQRLTEGGRDATAFHQWQKEIHLKELQEELDKVERRYLERHIDYNEGIISRKAIQEQNQRAAQLKKEETAELMRRYAEKRFQEEKKMKLLVQEVIEDQKNAKIAKEALLRMKQRIVREVSVQNQELLHRALEEAQAELTRKIEIIQEIHSIETVPLMRFKKFDDTETAGWDLLGEMSLAELRERLVLLKEKKQIEQEEKRKQILELKEKEKQETEQMVEILDQFEREKKALAQAAAVRKQEERDAKLRIEQAVKQSEPILALRKKVEEKKQEFQRVKDEDRQRMAEFVTGKTLKTSTQQNTFYQKTFKVKTWEQLENELEDFVQDNGV